MADDSQSSSLQLTIRLTTHPVLPVPTNYPLSTTRTATVADLKQQLQREFDGKPLAEGIVCVKGGRVCKDTEVLGELFPAETSPADTLLHVIVKPSSWSAPFTLPTPTPTPTTPVVSPLSPTTPRPPASTSSSSDNPSYAAPAPPETPATPAESLSNLTSVFTSAFTGASPTPTAPAPAPTAPTSPSLGPSVAGYPTYLAFLSQLIPLQRSLLLLNLQKAHYFYSANMSERLARLGWADSPTKAEGEEEQKVDETGELEEVKGLLVECGLWGLVKEKEDEAEVEIKEWGKGHREADEFQLVQINGLPFMLQVPVDPNAVAKQTPPDLELYRSLKRGQAILHVLTTMLQLLITYQPTAPAIAYGRALLHPAGATGAAATAEARAAARALPNAQAANAAALAAAAQRRRATVSIVINLEAILSLIVPLFLLSLKLGFLLWIFGRHASSTKRLVMGGMAAAWILWEGVGMYRRRAVAGALRDRVDRERERAARHARRAEAAAQAGVPAPPADPAGLHHRRAAPAAVPGPAVPVAPRERHHQVPPARAVPPPPGVPGAAAAALAARPHRAPTRPRREPHSRLSPRYWIARIATIGLVEEAHELGLAPRTVAGRHVPHPPPQPLPNDRAGLARQARRRAIRTALVAFVLFFGTLSPEVERKRKRALEKRERLLAEKRAQRERQAAERAAALAGGQSQLGAIARQDQGGLQPPELRSGASTPGLFEGDHGEATHGLPQNPQPSTSASSHAGPSSTTTSNQQDDADRTPVTSPAGRAVVSDAELFADGLGEPNQEPLALDGTESPAEPAQEAADGDGQGEGDGTEGETETSEDEDDQRAAGEDEGEVDQVVALF